MRIRYIGKRGVVVTLFNFQFDLLAGDGFFFELFECDYALVLSAELIGGISDLGNLQITDEIVYHFTLPFAFFSSAGRALPRTTRAFAADSLISTGME